MRSFIRIMVAVALTVMSIAGIVSVASAESGTISGFVYQTDNTTKIIGATVSAYNTNGDLVNYGSMGISGYSVIDLPVGSYRLVARAEGYFDQEYPTLVSTGSTLVNFSMTAGNSIKGTVYNDNLTETITTAFVRARDPATGDELYSSYSNITGQYSITVPPGDYKVEAYAKGWSAEFYDSQTSWAAASVVSIAGSDNVGIDFSLAKSGYISGHVYHADNATPLTTAAIYAYDSSGTQKGVGHSGPTDNAAYYINLAPGGNPYRIVAIATGYVAQWWEGVQVGTEPTTPSASEPYWSACDPITVMSGEENPNHNFAMLPVQVVATNAASGVTSTSATLNGDLTSMGAATSDNVFFEWGLTDSYGDETPLQAKTSTGPFSADVTTGLSPNTTYHFRAKAVGYVTSYGDDATFTTSAEPTVVTDNASGITTTAATLNGNLTALGTAPAVNVSFEWGPTTSYGSVAAGTPPSMTAPGNFSANLTSLAAKTTYHFRAIAAGDGTALGNDMTLTTSTIPPTVTTNDASSLATTTATLNGNLTALGTAPTVNVSFEWGLTDSYGQKTTLEAKNNAPSTFSVNLTSLTAKTTYHFRAIAAGDGSPVYGSDMTFTTLTIPPAVTTNDAGSLATTSATLNGDLTAMGTTADNVTVSFEYGTTSGGSYTAVAAGSKASTGTFSVNLSSLTPGATYYFRAVADGDGDPVYGLEKSFTTSSTPPTVTTDTATSILAASARLNGNLTSLGTAGSVSVSFLWATAAGGPYTETTAQVKTSTGAFSADLTGLSAVKTYYYKTKVVVSGGTPIFGTEKTFTTIDATAPEITVVASGEITLSEATITWTTNELATSQVEYGLTEEYGSVTTMDTNLRNNHSVTLADLKSGKTYHYRVKSQDASRNEAISADNTFTTTARSGGMPAWAWVIIGIGVVGAAGAAAFLIRGKLAQG